MWLFIHVIIELYHVTKNGVPEAISDQDCVIFGVLSGLFLLIAAHYICVLTVSRNRYHVGQLLHFSSWPLLGWIHFWKLKHIFMFCHLSNLRLSWSLKSPLNPPSPRRQGPVFLYGHMANITAVDDLATQRARISTAMVLTLFPRDVLLSARSRKNASDTDIYIYIYIYIYTNSSNNIHEWTRT